MVDLIVGFSIGFIFGIFVLSTCIVSGWISREEEKVESGIPGMKWGFNDSEDEDEDDDDEDLDGWEPRY